MRFFSPTFLFVWFWFWFWFVSQETQEININKSFLKKKKVSNRDQFILPKLQFYKGQK